MTTAQTITEATADKLVESIHKLDVTIAVLIQQMEAQNKWNQEQQKINIAVSEKITKISEDDIERDGRIKALEGWKNWLSGVFTALLLSVLLAVVAASMYFTYGVHH